MTFRAAFFDRDNTLLHSDPVAAAERRAKIESWAGRPVSLTYEKMMELFARAGRSEKGLSTVEEEVVFWRRYYKELLLDYGIRDCLEERAEELHRMTWLKGYQLFPETIEVLEWFKSRGYRLGVISDTSPSLPLTLEAAGIGQYFDCAICSDLVGTMKPEPAIYQAALDVVDVSAEESLYVDDYDVEADGARNMGFTAFHIDRSLPGDGRWRINSLVEMVRYVESITGS